LTGITQPLHKNAILSTSSSSRVLSTMNGNCGARDRLNSEQKALTVPSTSMSGELASNSTSPLTMLRS
jgi:hypothetical protein